MGLSVWCRLKKDRYERMVADLFVIRPDGSEIHLNSQMVADGHAYHYTQYSDSGLQPIVLDIAEEQAKSTKAGL